MLGADPVQMGYQSMEIMDRMDKVTPISGDYKELIPLYIGNGHSG